MKKNRIVSAVVALAVAPLLMVAPVSMAAIPGISVSARDPRPATVPSQKVDISKAEKSAIRVIKYGKAANNGVDTPTGKPMTVKGETVKDVVFKVRQIKTIDGTALPDAAKLSTNAGYKALADLLTPNTGKPKGEVTYVDGKDKTAKTNEQGEADFTDLSFGLYEVSEVSAPAGYTKAETFYVALPFVDHSTDTVQGTTWNYAPVFYPKNLKDTLEKTVKDDTATGVGSPISYTLKGSISSANPGEYVISDQLSDKVKLKTVEVKLDKAGTDVALTVNDDYTLAGTAEQTGQNVTVTLTDDGLAKLKAAYDETAETKVVVTINGEIAALPGADNDRVAVPNVGHLIPNNSTQWDTPLPSNPVESKFGGIKIHKVAHLDNSVNLQGAKFKVYASKDDATKQQNELTFLDKEGNEVTAAVTGADGFAVIEGLRASDYADGVDGKTDEALKYWVVETVAPEGYSVLPEPIEVSVASTDADNDHKIDLTEKQIENVKVNAGFYMPKTGLGGPFGFVLAGSVLLAAGGVAIVVARRGREQEA